MRFLLNRDRSHPFLTEDCTSSHASIRTRSQIRIKTYNTNEFRNNPKSARWHKRTRHLLRNQMVLGRRNRIPTNREPRSHRHNPKNNLPNTPNSEHKRTPRHNQRKDTTRRPIKSPKPPSPFFSPFLTKTKNWQINIPLLSCNTNV